MIPEITFLEGELVRAPEPGMEFMCGCKIKTPSRLIISHVCYGLNATEQDIEQSYLRAAEISLNALK